MMKTNESYSPLYIPPSLEVENVNVIFYDLIDIGKKYTKNFLICHLNINSMMYKFEVDGYKLQRRDRTDSGGED